MFLIEEEKNIVEQKVQKLGEEFLVSEKHKVDREKFILFRFCELLKKSKQKYPTYAKAMNPPEPDFHTFTSNSLTNLFKQIEIVENIHYNRKRRMREQNTDEFEYNKNVWNSFSENLNKKFYKIYGKDSWLLMYHNIPASHISKYGFWINLVFANKELLSKKGEIDFNKSPYEKIFVMSSGFDELVRIYPINEVVISKDSNYSIY